MLRVGELQGVDPDDARLAAGLDDGADGGGRDDVVLSIRLVDCVLRDERGGEGAKEKRRVSFFFIFDDPRKKGGPLFKNKFSLTVAE